ncbi:TlpA family protein disulfide reductase [Acidiphilium sp. PA]|uniref:TlpA disulfide reductase family protein n=1 Tax=Acidiphilium sp. PA TaxID=2871705 RepID=UPI002243D178|nr:TlpA disulfide reductase family protein [Acidiphilium sp. PA]MCW8308032.1 TlpA family protein disulfide reductase [Acidiphilium sp. PA]
MPAVIWMTPNARAARRGRPPAFYSYDGQYTQIVPQRPVPIKPIVTDGGSIIDFQRLRGEVVLINFWATWCVPCVYEMPLLDRLQAKLKGTKATILPIAVDDGNKANVEAFYKKHDLTHLKVIVDPDQQVGYFNAANPGRGIFPLYALPITYVINPNGLIVGYVPGAARWDSPRAMTLISYVASHQI